MTVPRFGAIREMRSLSASMGRMFEDTLNWRHCPAPSA